MVDGGTEGGIKKRATVPVSVRWWSCWLWILQHFNADISVCCSSKESLAAAQEMAAGEEGSAGVVEDELEEETQPRISCSEEMMERISQIFVKMEHFTLQVTHNSGFRWIILLVNRLL